jgi:cytochrome c-type biogenesis protein
MNTSLIMHELAQSFKAGCLSNFSACTYPISLSFLAVLLAIPFGFPPEKSKNQNDYLYVPLLILSFSSTFMILGADVCNFRILPGAQGLKLLLCAGVIGFAIWLMVSRGAGSLAPKHPALVNAIAATLIGIVLAIEWIPCAGPVLGRGLELASEPDTRLRGMAHLFFYAWGIGFPFAILGMALCRIFKARVPRGVPGLMAGVISGSALAMIGCLMMTNHFSYLAQWLPDIRIAQTGGNPWR